MKVRFFASFAALACLSVLTPVFASSPSETRFPSHVTYAGEIIDAGGTPIEGAHTMALSYLGTDGELLLSETFENVVVSRGHFSIELGAGATGSRSLYPSLQATFAEHPS